MTDCISDCRDKRLLWVDDQIENFRPWFQRFAENGVYVDPFPSIEEAFEGMGATPYDAIFLDQLMPGRRGSEALMQFKAKAPTAPLYICSGYFYLDDVLDDFERTRRQAGVSVSKIDKTTLPLTDDPDGIARFLKNVLSDPQAPERISHEVTQKLNELGDSDVVRWSDYSSLDFNGKLEVHNRVDELTRSARAASVGEGACYMVFCGSWTTPVHVGYDESAYLAESQLLHLALDTGFAPFAYSVGGSVDDLTQQCSSRNSMRGYPAIRVSKGGNHEALHFDTGNPLTLLSYEHYTMNGWIEPVHAIQTHFAGELILRGKRQKVEDVVFTDSKAATRFGPLTAFAVLMWHEYRLAARCLSDCRFAQRPRDRDGLCYFRNGLLGRTLGRDIDCEFQVSVDSGSVVFRTRSA